jgi:hypothetical protein
VLQSMLMALEKWLLAFAKQSPEELDAILLDILRRSDSAALAAVVAGVGIAHPHASGEALLVLLSARDYIQIDRSRMVGERQVSGLTGMFPTFEVDHQVYEAERKEANALPHRGHDIESAITNLQLGPLAPRVQAILDRHLAALPPKEEQEEGDRVWRLAIHRMDFRQYTVSETPGPDILGTEPGAPPRHYVRFDPKPPDADVQAMIDESTSRMGAMNERLGVYMWGLQAFNRETGKYDASQWAATLDVARAIDRGTDHQDGSRQGPGFVAAVCIRDYWDQMSSDQRGWCVDVVCSEVMRYADEWNEFERMQRNSMAADRASAFVLALLLRKTLPEPQGLRVRQAFAATITHPIAEVRMYAAWSIDEAFWAADGAVALRCVKAIAAEAGLIDTAWRAEQKRRYDERRKLPEIMNEAATAVRERFWQDGAIAEDAHNTVDITKGFGADASIRMLIILGRVPEDTVAVAAFARASKTLVGWWDSDRERRRDRNFHTEAAVSERLQHFLIRTSPAAAQEVVGPVLSAIDRHSREIQPIVQGLTSIQDRNPNTPQYWFLWGLFSEGVKRAKWVSRLGASEHPDGSELLSAIFLTSFWKDNVRHWRFLDGYAHLVHGLFDALPPTSIVLDDYVRFLYHIGERSLPEAFARIADALRRGNAPEMLEKTNTVFMLEVLLQRYVYGRPLELKLDARIREAVLFILDNLVETGSSAAFRMRDDFVTPAG